MIDAQDAKNIYTLLDRVNIQGHKERSVIEAIVAKLAKIIEAEEQPTKKVTKGAK